MSECSGCTKEEGAKLVQEYKEKYKHDKKTQDAKALNDETRQDDTDITVDTVFADCIVLQQCTCHKFLLFISRTLFYLI